MKEYVLLLIFSLSGLLECNGCSCRSHDRPREIPGDEGHAQDIRKMDF